MTRRRWLLALSACLLPVTFAVQGWALGFPYVQEDWELLGPIADEPYGEAVVAAFGAIGGVHYRPLVTLHHITEFALFGEDARFSHVLVLVLLGAGALAIAALIERLTGDRLLAGLVALGHAAANVIHIDPLLIQTCGIENLGGSLFFYASTLLFLHKRDGWSALLFAMGLLLKETVIVLPGFLLLSAWCDRSRLRSVVVRLWPFALVCIAFALVKSRGPSPFAPPETRPYFMALYGPHLFGNLAAYLGWASETMLPGLSRRLSPVLIGSVLLASLLIASRFDPVQKRELGRRAAYFVGWFLLAVGPMLLLPNHTYRYYLVFALPAALAVWWSAIGVVLGALLRAPRRAAGAAAMLASLGCVASMLSFRGRLRDRIDLDGTNETIKRARTVEEVRAFLRATRVPRGATLLFDGLEVWAFGKDLGPRLWCDDRTLRVFYARDLHVGPSGDMAIVNAARHQGELYTGARNRTELEPARTLVISKREGRLVLEPVSDYVKSRVSDSQRSEPVLSGVQ